MKKLPSMQIVNLLLSFTSDIQDDWLNKHDFVMANITCPNRVSHARL